MTNPPEDELDEVLEVLDELDPVPDEELPDEEPPDEELLDELPAPHAISAVLPSTRPASLTARNNSEEYRIANITLFLYSY